MNPDQHSRDQIEARLTALLLGELPADEAALLRYTMAQDPALQQLHDELRATLGLVREAAKHPADALVAKNAPPTLKLSAERRQQLLAHFQTPRPKAPPQPLFWLKRIEMPRLVLVLAAVACIAVLAAMLLPSLAAAKRKSMGRAQYSTHEPSAQDIVESLSELATKRSPAKPALAQAQAANPAPPPSDAPVQVTLTAEPQLAPPPVASPPVQIVLPRPESAPEIVAQAGEPAEAGKGPVYSQHIVGYANLPAGAVPAEVPLTTRGSSVPAALAPAPPGPVPPPSDTAAGQLTLNYNDGIKTFDTQKREEHVEKQWILPAQALDSSVSLNKAAGGMGGSGFGGGGGVRGFYDAASGNINGTPTPQSANSALGGGAIPPPVQPLQLLGSPTPVLALNDVSADQFKNSALQSRAVGGVAGNRYYRSPAQESEEKKAPLLGDVPIVGNLFQSSAQSAKPAPAATPAPATPAPPAPTTALSFDFNAGALQARTQDIINNGATVTFNTAPAPSAGGFTLGVASDSFNTGVAKEEPPLPGLATAGSVNLVEENKSFDAERTRELQDRRGNHQVPGLDLPQSNAGAIEPVWVGVLANPKPGQVSGFGARENGNHFVSRYSSAAPSPGALDQLQTTNTVAMNGSGNNSVSPGTAAIVPETIDINEALDRYGKLTGRTMMYGALPLGDKISLPKSLPKEAEKQALEAVLALNGVSLVNVGDKYVKVVPSTDAGAAGGTITGDLPPSKLPELAVNEAAPAPGGLTQSDALASGKAAEGLIAQDPEKAAKDQPYETAKRDLQQKLKMHELLHSKLQLEKVDLSLPETSMVHITDPAEPGTTQNFWQRLTGQVESKARVKVESDVTDIPGLMLTPTTTSFDPYFIQTTFEIMKSEAVLGKVVDALSLQTAWASKNGGEKLTKSEAIAALKQRLDLQPVKNTKQIEIGAKSDDPKEAADIANAVAKAYADYRVESRRDLSTNGIAVLEDQFGQQTKEIQLAQAEVDRLGKDLAPKQNQTEPAAEPSDIPLRKPAPNAPVPQPEILTHDNNFSTFSLNVSDVSFKFAEASLQNGKLPDTASIRSEEFINAFDYRDPEAAAGQPMAFTSERAHYPFAYNRELLRFAVKTAAAGRPAGRALNLVLLLDNSGSMERADRVAIIRESLRVLATQLQPQDTVSVVTFARTARLWADGLSGDKAGATLDQVGGITPEGGTNLEEAMRLAYETAHRHYLPNGLNRVVLLTDGAANLGNVEPEALKQKVEAQRKQGIALDCFGIGWEDYNDDLLEQLSSHGDGRYAFLNSPEDASKDFATKLAGALQIAAADVKVQVEFNPGRVLSYRQIGYARHQLTKEQFRDNTVAAGEIAAQEAGNALYTIETNPNGDGPIATVHVRYRIPGTADYREHSWDVAYTGSAPTLDQSNPAMRLAATASAFSEWLAASPYAQEVTLDELLKVLSGVPEVYGADDRPKQLETMIREAKSLEGK